MPSSGISLLLHLQGPQGRIHRNFSKEILFGGKSPRARYKSLEAHKVLTYKIPIKVDRYTLETRHLSLYFTMINYIEKRAINVFSI